MIISNHFVVQILIRRKEGYVTLNTEHYHEKLDLDNYEIIKNKTTVLSN